MATTGAAVSGLSSTASAEATHHGITFDTVLNAVDDLGMDNTGSTTVDAELDSGLASGTLIEFPPGTYRIGERHFLDNMDRVGLRGTGTSRRDVKFAPTSGSMIKMFDSGVDGSGAVLIENLSFDDLDDTSSLAAIVITTSGGSVVHNVEWLGKTPEVEQDTGPDAQFIAQVNDESGTFLIEDVYAGLDQPSVKVTYPDGIGFFYGGSGHVGEVILRNPVIHERNSAATRYTNCSGVVTIEGGEFVNNQNANIRFTPGSHPSKDSSVNGTRVVVDGSRNSGDAVRVETSGSPDDYGAVFENMDIEWTKKTARGVFCVPSYNTSGGFTIRNCTVYNDGDPDSCPTVSAVDSNIEKDAVVIENSGFTGSGGGFIAEDRPDSIIRDSTIDMPNASISGFDTENISSESSPVIDSISVSEVETSDSDAEFDVSWQVSDSDGDLSSVDLTLTDDTDGGTEDSASISVSGDTASDTARLVAAGDDGSGNAYTVDLTVTDAAGNTTSNTASVTESDPSSSPVIDSISVSEVETSDSDAEFDVSWQVSDSDGDLSSVDLTLTDDTDAQTEDTAAVDVSGDSATGTTRLVAAGDDGSGNAYTVDLTVTDAGGATTTTTTEVNEYYPNDLTIEGTGVQTEYSFTVSEALEPVDSTIEEWDDVSSTSATGWITTSGAVDKYTFKDEVTDFAFLEGEANIYINGQQVGLDYFESDPVVDRFEVTEAGSQNPHANITADWEVSDADGNLSNVTVEVIDSSGTVVASASNSVSGSEAYDVNYFEIKHVDGQTFDVRATVTDSTGKQSSATRSVTE